MYGVEHKSRARQGRLKGQHRPLAAGDRINIDWHNPERISSPAYRYRGATSRMGSTFRRLEERRPAEGRRVNLRYPAAVCMGLSPWMPGFPAPGTASPPRGLVSSKGGGYPRRSHAKRVAPGIRMEKVGPALYL